MLSELYKDLPLAPPDITQDRIVIISGGSMVLLTDTMVQPTNSSPTWVTLVPTEPTQMERAGGSMAFYPRERHVQIKHDMWIGTVAELVARFEEGLVRAFDLYATKMAEAMFGECSLRKQKAVLMRNQLDRCVADGLLAGVSYKVFRERQARRNQLSGFTPRQDVFERDVLMRLAAEYSCRRIRSSEQGPPPLPDPSPPSNNVDRIQELIDALIILKEDVLAEKATAKP